MRRGLEAPATLPKARLRVLPRGLSGHFFGHLAAIRQLVGDALNLLLVEGHVWADKGPLDLIGTQYIYVAGLGALDRPSGNGENCIGLHRFADRLAQPASECRRIAPGLGDGVRFRIFGKLKDEV